MEDSFQSRCRRNNRTTLCSLFRFDTVPGYDGAGSHAERAQRLSAGEAFALPKRALQGDIPMLARRSRPPAGVPDPTQGPRPAAGGQHERALRGPRELRLRVHRLSGGGNLRLILDRTGKSNPRRDSRLAQTLVPREQRNFLTYRSLKKRLFLAVQNVIEIIARDRILRDLRRPMFCS